ncbi:MAG: hypothetical protein GY841_20155, partial [FCB group bacterium]|nr:hypothetical protein [FCB group bacterium]
NSNEGRQIELHSIFSNTTEGTKDGTLNRVKVYDVDDDAKTEQLVYVVADAASAANFFNGKSDWGDVPIVSGVGNRLVVRITNDVALTAPTLKCQWRSVPVVPRGTATLNGISSQ